jgi:hypothetical protein
MPFNAQIKERADIAHHSDGLSVPPNCLQVRCQPVSSRKCFDDLEPAVSRIRAVGGSQQARLFENNHITANRANVSIKTIGEHRYGQRSSFGTPQQSNALGRQDAKEFHRILKGYRHFGGKEEE